MKEGLIVGMLLGLAAGALLFKHSPAAKEVFNKGEEAVKNEISNMVKEIDKKVSK